MEGVAAQSRVLDLLTQAEQALSAATAGLDEAASLSDAELMAVTEPAGSMRRLSDSVMVRALCEVERQCRVTNPARSLAARHGLRDGTATPHASAPPSELTDHGRHGELSSLHPRHCAHDG